MVLVACFGNTMALNVSMSIDRRMIPHCHPRKTNLEHCLAQIEALGYSCESFVLDAAWYGLPQGRKRIYLVCFSLTRQDISVSAETFFGNIKKLLTKLYIKPPAVDPVFDLHIHGACCLQCQLSTVNSPLELPATMLQLPSSMFSQV